MDILAIESSCDETAAAVIRDGRKILSSVIHTQVQEHGRYGGVVPEIASRRHIEQITAVVERALQEAGHTIRSVDAVAVTAAPGLIGALLVGVNYAKGLALAAGKPLIPVHHLRGHLAANYLCYPQLQPPFLGLIVSGGHSHIVEVRDYTEYRIIGRTRDDAAGEAFDKAARAMGLPYPGGVSIDRITSEGNAAAFASLLPVPHLSGSGYDFSFSGLKTAVINLLHTAEQRGEALCVADLAASFAYRVADILVGNTLRAAEEFHYRTLVMAGGVSANSTLRKEMGQACEKRGIALFAPPLPLCGDNAAMIGAQAFYQYQKGYLADMSLNASACMEIDREF